MAVDRLSMKKLGDLSSSASVNHPGIKEKYILYEHLKFVFMKHYAPKNVLVS